jgi:metallopeptidase MepB
MDAWKEEVKASGLPDQEPSAQIPDDIIRELVATRNINQNLFHLEALRRSMFDMMIHQPESHESLEEMDFGVEWVRLDRELVILDHGDSKIEGDNRYMMIPQFVKSGDYDAGYYSYLFSQVFADDIFHAVFERDPMSPVAGLRYRKVVLEKGGSENGLKLLEDLLGRKPNELAFHEGLGLD